MPAASLTVGDYALLALYLLLVVVIGAWFNRRSTTTAEYLLGGRRMAWWLIGVSYIASLLSTVSMVGAPGEAFKHGVTSVLWPIFGVSLSIGFFFIFIRFYFQTETFTPFAYLERRFGATCRGSVAGIYCLARAFYLAVVLFAAAKVFQGTANWPMTWTIVVIGGVGVLYTAMGGMRAVVWTDFFQFIILFGGILIVLAKLAMVIPGGLPEVFRYAQAQDHLFPDFHDPSFFSLNPYVRLTLWAILFRAVGDHLFYKSADQILIQRMLSTSGYWQAFRSVLFGSLLAPIMLVLLYAVGLGIFRFYADVPAASRPAPDLALFRFITAELPSPMPGLIVAAMAAAIMSTFDSGINSLATVLTKDFYRRFFATDADEDRQLRFSRRMTVVCGAAVIALALWISRLATSVGGTVLESSGIWMSLLVVLVPVFLMGVTSRRAKEHHALIALACGCLTTLLMTLWYYHAKRQGHDPGFHMVAVGSLAVGLLAGLILPCFSPRAGDDELANLTLWTLRPKPDDSQTR